MRHRLEYLLVLLVGGLTRALPYRAALACGSGIGLAVYGLDGMHRRLALRNLARAFPTRSPAEHRAIARGVFRHFGRLLIGLLKFSAMRPDRMLQLVEVEGAERVRQAHALNRGVLLFTGHFGFWEINALVHSLVIEPFSVVARALDNPHLHRLLERVRTTTGNTVIYRRGGIRRVLRALAANQGVALLIDQHIHGGDAVMVEFFGRPAATTSALASLALRTGAPVIPVFAMPLPGGRFRIVYEPPVQPPGPDAADPVRELTQRCTDVLEMYVRRHPDLWLWMHRRWRDADPETAAAPGMFPAARRNEELRLELED